MSAKKWLLAFILSVAGLFALLAGFNWLVDPFGLFGDPVFDWYSYNMTQNPRAAKIAWLDDHFDDYDSYLIGCSATSSYPVETLNRYYNASFFNMIMYGADLQDVEQSCRYVLEHDDCRNIIISLYLDNGLYYDDETDPYTYSMHAKADGSCVAAYYLRYLFAKPTYAIDKLVSLRDDTFLKQSFDAFDPVTGAYDKLARDIEPIGSTEDYLAAYPVFASYPQSCLNLDKIQQTADCLQRIVQMCENAGVSLTVVHAPVYYDYFNDFSPDEILAYYQALAEVTDFWDFSMSSVSCEMRYFYDATHFRNCVGDMAIARIFGDDGVYIPEDFGNYITSENVTEIVSSYQNCSPSDESDYTATVPILTYHHLDPEADGSNAMVLTPDAFDAQMQALLNAGYTTVSLDELQAYVEYGADLPDKPVVITFDDGYYSNYEYAFPILQKYGMKATIFVIGSSMGKDTYKETGEAIIPHFGAAEIAEMTASGCISIQSHTYDMHQSERYEASTARQSILPLEGEAEEDYISLLREDIRLSRSQLEQAGGDGVDALAYPRGETSELAAVVLSQEGIHVTLTSEPGINTLLKGVPQSLLGLRRNTVTPDMTTNALLQLIRGARG